MPGNIAGNKFSKALSEHLTHYSQGLQVIKN
jgi:hypothetical protein